MLQWQEHPSELADRTEDWWERALKVCLIVAGDWALRMEAHAKDHARWTDRTSNARQGLTGRAQIDGTAIVIWLYHTMDYGIWLEVANAGNYAIIMETIYLYFQDVLDEMKQAIGG